MMMNEMMMGMMWAIDGMKMTTFNNRKLLSKFVIFCGKLRNV